VGQKNLFKGERKVTSRKSQGEEDCDERLLNNTLVCLGDLLNQKNKEARKALAMMRYVFAKRRSSIPDGNAGKTTPKRYDTTSFHYFNN